MQIISPSNVAISLEAMYHDMQIEDTKFNPERLCKLICKHMSWSDFIRAKEYLPLIYKMRSRFPTLAHFQEAARLAPINRKQSQVQTWQEEYAEKLGLPVEEFALMKISDLNMAQKKQLELLEPEEQRKLFKDIYNMLDKHKKINIPEVLED